LIRLIRLVRLVHLIRLFRPDPRLDQHRPIHP
jgi:hypothetical protein